MDVRGDFLGVLGGAPFVFLCGRTDSVLVLVVALTAWGLFKGLYDANIWASLYDVIHPSRRASAVGVMNMVGWLGGALGAYGIGAAVQKGATMSAAIASVAVLYLGVAALLFAAAARAPADVRRAAADGGGG